MASPDFNAQIIEEFRANDGRVGGMFEDRPLLLRRHTGARSGRRRINPLVYQSDGGRYVVFASKAGAPANPDSYHNLKAHPDVTIERRDRHDRRRRQRGDRRGARSPLRVQAERFPAFAEYQRQTERVIPAVVLTPARTG